MAPRFETIRDSPKLKEKSKQVEDLEAQVNALKIKESALGYPAQAYPAEQQLSKSQYYPGVQYGAVAGSGGYGLQAMRNGGDGRAWYDQQKRIITAELEKERLALSEKLTTHYDLQRQQYLLQLEAVKLHKLEEMQLKREVRLRNEMDYRAKVGKKEDIMIVTTAQVPGYRIKDVCGAVMGFGLINAIYHEAEEEEDDLEEELMLSPHVARVEAVEHMISDAQQCHANAVVSFQWTIRPLDAERTKVLAQGTAVTIERDGPLQCGECGTVRKKQKGDGGGNDNQKGNFKNDHEYFDDLSTSFSGGGPPTANTQKQKQQQQQQKGKGGPGATNGGGGKGQVPQQQQGKKNKGKQNNISKASENDNDDTRPDDDNDNDNNDDNSLNSDADEDDNPPSKTNKQQQGKGKGQNNQNQGGGGKGGKGQKLTPAQQIVKLLAEAKIREDRQKTEETEKERLYKHMEILFKDRNSKSNGWGSSSSKEVTTMDWLKKIEQEIEERNKKQNGGKVNPSSSNSAGSSGWGNDNGRSNAGSVGWGDTAEDSGKKSEDKRKDKPKDKKNNNNNSGSGNQANKPDAWNTDDPSAQNTQAAPQQDGWGDADTGRAQTQIAGGGAWGDDNVGTTNDAGEAVDIWGEPTSGNNTSAAPGGGWV